MRNRELGKATDEQLLDMRFCDLPITVKAPFIAKHLGRLRRELQYRGLQFVPHVWLADEWFSVDGIPGFAIPFYLAHPRLMRLERRMLGEVEGGNSNWMMRILRHETAHAYDNAYRLRRRKDWREMFGKASLPYPSRYRPNTGSRNYVLHLGLWYAQSHPTEDFAETFAVCLQPRAAWQRIYANWPLALRKLQYVRDLMRELQTAEPKATSRKEFEPIARNRRTLREHYRRELRRYEVEQGRHYDKWLHRVFVCEETGERSIPAAQLLRELRETFTRKLADRLHLQPYHVHNIVRALIERCEELRLVGRGRHTDLRYRTQDMVAKVLREYCTVDRTRRSRQQYAV